eukprot:scaffold8556_cov286-Pinguiococcus_pyrenoidosus.AAC.15
MRRVTPWRNVPKDLALPQLRRESYVGKLRKYLVIAPYSLWATRHFVLGWSPNPGNSQGLLRQQREETCRSLRRRGRLVLHGRLPFPLPLSRCSCAGLPLRREASAVEDANLSALSFSVNALAPHAASTEKLQKSHTSWQFEVCCGLLLSALAPNSCEGAYLASVAWFPAMSRAAQEPPSRSPLLCGEPTRSRLAALYSVIGSKSPGSGILCAKYPSAPNLQQSSGCR